MIASQERSLQSREAFFKVESLPSNEFSDVDESSILSDFRLFGVPGT
jgi:hypothetical protein